jgi:hypothetical protein
MLRRIRQLGARAIAAALGCVYLAAGAPLARAQAPEDDQYHQPLHATEDQLALAFIAGRYATPITCKKTDGSVLELEDSILMKEAPDAGGGNAVKVTFFGVDVPDLAYCYNLVERRVLDRRGSIFIHFRAHKRADMGVSDFRRAMNAGPLTYNAHRGELRVRGIGTEADAGEAREVPFDGGDAKLVVSAIQNGTDGAKLLADYDERTGNAPSPNRRRFMFQFTAKDGSEFTFYAVEAGRPRK